ncbi:MAG: YfiR/HmsC family protein [Gammaproteobacteria bacterium]|nr:YfiR/HmsC family protein [Gammaproteobacteria bacterium]
MLRLPGKIGLMALLCLASFVGLPSLAQDAASPRLQIGINLLPAIIAANQSLAVSDGTNNLPIYLVYRENRHLAKQLEPGLRQVGEIRKRKLEITILSLDELLSQGPAPLSVVFITEPLDQRLPELVELAEQQRILLFSPFKGDVELGVTTGFQVTDKVLPLVNMASLKQSKIKLKAFFLRIAVKHE